MITTTLLIYLIGAIITMATVTVPSISRVRIGVLWPVVAALNVLAWIVKPFAFGRPLEPMFCGWMGRHGAKFYGFTTERCFVGIVRVKL